MPLRIARVRLPGWILALNIPGLPYSEPTFTSIAERKSTPPEYISSASPPDVTGIAYLVTLKQYVQVIASEGGGTAYDDIEVDALPVTEEDEKKTGPKIRVRTLGSAMVRDPWPRPSRRYMVSDLTAYFQRWMVC